MLPFFRISARFAKTSLVLIASTFATAPVFAQPQPPPDDIPSTRREMPGRGIKGAGFAGLNPAEAQAAADLLAEGNALEERGNLRGALGKYKRVFKRYPRSASAPEAYYRTAQIEIKRDRPLKAFEAIDAIVRAYPNYGKFDELIAEEYRIAYELLHGKRLKMFGVLPGFPNEDRGIYFMERLIFNAPFSDLAPLALMNIAEAHARHNRTGESIDALDRLITSYPSSILAPDAYLRMGQVHEQTVDGPLYDQAATKDAIDYYEDFLILFPRHSEVGGAEEGLARMKDMLAKSRFKIADFYYQKRARYQAARVFYNEAITIAPTSETAALARERIAQLDVDEARYEARLAAAAEEPRRGLLGGLFGGRSDAATSTGATAMETELQPEVEEEEAPVTPAGTPRSPTVTPAP